MSTALCEFGQKSDEATKAGSIAMTRAVAVDWDASHLQKLLLKPRTGVLGLRPRSIFNAYGGSVFNAPQQIWVQFSTSANTMDSRK